MDASYRYPLNHRNWEIPGGDMPMLWYAFRDGEWVDAMPPEPVARKVARPRHLLRRMIRRLIIWFSRVPSDVRRTYELLGGRDVLSLSPGEYAYEVQRDIYYWNTAPPRTIWAYWKHEIAYLLMTLRGVTEDDD